MREGTAVWHAARDLALAGTRAAVATICRHRGSLPMATDAKIVVAEDGARFGTVGGGCVEADVMAQALGTLDAGAPTLVQHSLTAEAAGDIGLSCGGTAEFFLEPVVHSADMAALYGAVGDAIEARKAVAVFTALDWSRGPRKAADIEGRLVEVGDGEWSHMRTLSDHDAADRTFVDEERGVFVELVERVPRVVIFGAGHVGREIARVAAGTGFHVVVIDDREEFANEQDVPWAHEIAAEDFRTALDRMTFDEDDFVIAATRGHSFDAYVVERVAPSKAQYVGMLGSRRKRDVIWRALEAAGVAREALERVKVPIGEEIGAETPAEIAVAAVAELVRVRRSVA